MAKRRYAVYYCRHCKQMHRTCLEKRITTTEMAEGRIFHAHRAYALVPQNPMDAVRHSGVRNAMYEAFHNAPPERARQVSIPVPEGPLVAIGKAIRIEYEPYGSSKHKGTRFFHNWGDLGESKIKEKPILVADRNGHIFFVPTHPKYPIFSERGILG